MTFPAGGYATQVAAEADSLLAYVTFNEATAADTDPLGDNINGDWDTLVSGTGASVVSGMFSNATNFPSSATSAVGGSSLATTYNEWGLGFWVKNVTNDLTTTALLLDLSGGGYSLSLSMQTNGLVNALFHDGISETPIILQSTTAIDDGSWHHIGLTAQGLTVRLYIDGVSEDTDLDFDGMNAKPFHTIEWVGSSEGVFQLDDAGFWNRALVLGEYEDIYDSGTGAPLIQLEESPFERVLEESLEEGGATSYLMPVMNETLAEILDQLDSLGLGNISNLTLAEALTIEALFTSPESITVAESMTATDALTYTWYILRELSEAMETQDELPIPPYAKLMAETLLAVSVPTSMAIFDRGLEEDLVMADLYAIAWHKGLTETLEQSDDTDGLRRLIASLAETMYSTDVTTANRIADEVITEALSLADACLRFFEMIAAENLSIAHTQVVDAKFGNELVEALETADSASDNYGFSIVIAEEFTASDGATAGAILNHVIEEGMAFLNITPVINGGTYSGWVMNPETFAVWNYENYNFNSFAAANNEVYGAATDGIYLMDANTDAGVSIESRLTTAAIDFGTKNLKQVPQVYLGMTSDGTIVLKVKVDNKADVWYEATPVESYEHTHMVKLGKGLVGRNWQFSLVTKDNSSIDIESLEFYPVVFKRKR